ncbi:hypothetical protein HCK04_36030 [Microbispora sp. CL1-1]|nr:hypothetical protein [Microbispora sp. CL1-1]
MSAANDWDAAELWRGPGGVAARWCGGAVVRRRGGAAARWCGGAAGHTVCRRQT